MQKWPVVTVLVITYRRPIEIRRTLDALRRYLCYEGEIQWHLADDGSPSDYLPQLLVDYDDIRFSWTITERKGWGANVNKALRYINADYIFMCEDDYVAQRPLDLTCGVALMQAVQDIALVRYDGLEGHALTLHLEEVATELGTINYLRIDPVLSKHLNVYSNRPHLFHRRFIDFYGPYPEGKRIGETEEAYAHHVRDLGRENTNAPWLVALSDGVPRAFEHIGATWQGTEHDCENS